MELTSEVVGRRSARYRTTLTGRRTMNYAAAVEDNNPLYFDDTRPDGTIAPPMLSVALTWQMASRFDEFWNITGFPAEALARQVHYSESLQWHRPIGCDDILEIEAEVTAMLPHPAGAHMVVRYDATAEGAPIFTEYAGALLRDVRLTDGGRGKENVPRFSHFPQQDRAQWESKLYVDPLAAHVYDGCADVHFPIHTSVAFAQNVGLPGIILHGTATLAMALREITNREAGGDSRRLRALRCNFTGMVLPGTDIQVRLLGVTEGTEGTDYHFEVLNHEGKRAIRRACATFGT